MFVRSSRSGALISQYSNDFPFSQATTGPKPLLLHDAAKGIRSVVSADLCTQSIMRMKEDFATNRLCSVFNVDARTFLDSVRLWVARIRRFTSAYAYASTCLPSKCRRPQPSHPREPRAIAHAHHLWIFPRK